MLSAEPVGRDSALSTLNAALRLTKRDWFVVGACVAITILSLVIIVRYFGSAFPEASIEFRYDRVSSGRVAGSLLRAQRVDVRGMKHTAVFDADQDARVFLERSLGLDRANDIMRREVRVWYWHHRWFVPNQEEEYSVDVSTTGQVVSYTRRIPEARPLPALDAASARAVAERFLTRIGIPLNDLELVAQSERTLPQRIQRIFTWHSKSIHPAGAPYRHVVTVDGDSVSSYGQRLRVPEQWLRTYQELRSRNIVAGGVDLIFVIIILAAAVAHFIVRLRRGDLHIRFLLAIGAVTVVLVGGVTANSIPSALASYDTTTSYPAFVAQIVAGTALQSIGMAMLLIVICGAGEVLYRQRLPNQLAIPRLWTARSLASRRVFFSLVIGYTLVGFFIAYQVAFYIVASKFGAWSPAEIPYDDILNTAIPWVAVLFAGFFPAFSEEFLSRAFSIPFFQRVLHSRIAAIVVAGFIWGFGHATYPQQPFYIRGIEVGLAGVLLGFLMDRFGLLALLIWHYTVDAVYTSLLLFRSGNTYYVGSAALASLVFAVPLLVSIALYIRNRGFLPDDELTNATLPVSPPPAEAPAAVEAALPAPIHMTRARLTLAVAATAAAVLLIALREPSPRDVVDYRITKGEAKKIATAHLRGLKEPLPQRVAATPVNGFRSWDPHSPREEGGAPGGFDEVAATYMVRKGMAVDQLVDVMRTRVPAATWMVRFFTPLVKSEYFVEVDPRTRRVVGYHEYADERAPGARLEREAALAVAQTAFAAYGVAAREFVLKEALAFQQPNRRDWLFHFEERTPLVADAVRRVTVRVMGSEVTQFASTVKVPEAVYRDAAQQTLANVILLLLKIAGVIAALALVVTGAVVAARHGGLAWRRAMRITPLLAIIPIATAIAGYEKELFAYRTSASWETFRLGVITDLVRSTGIQILVLFIALAGMASLYPYAIALFRREGRQRFGRAAATAAVTAIGLLVAGRELLRLIAHRFPSIASVDEISIPSAISLPVPSLFETGDALFGTLLLCGAVALYATALGTWPKRWAGPAVTVAIVFCISLDSSARLAEMPLTIAAAIVVAVAVWLIGRFVLDGNLLAWPFAIFAASILHSAAVLAQNERADLRTHAAILATIAAAVVIWLAVAGGEAEGSDSTTIAVSDEA